MNAVTDPVFSATDHALMARALALAARGLYTTKPNPMVGCVIAHGDRIVGEGWHMRAGEPHAEAHALKAAGEAAPVHGVVGIAQRRDDAGDAGGDQRVGARRRAAMVRAGFERDVRGGAT